VDNMMSSNGVLQWNVSFVKLVHDWEVDLVLAFFGDEVVRIVLGGFVLRGRKLR